MRVSFIAVAVIALTACTQNDHVVSAPTTPTQGASRQSGSDLPSSLQGFSPRTLSPAEAAIIDTLAAINPAGAEVTRRLLSDKRVVSMTLPDSRSRQLLQRLDSLRRLAGAAALVAQAASDISASLVLVDHLDDRTANAIVVRRAGSRPRDFVILPLEAATGKHLSTALGVLFGLRRKLGDVPSTNLRVAIHGLKTPTKWSADLSDQADQIVRAMKADTITTIPGIGRGRVRSIPLVAAKTANP